LVEINILPGCQPRIEAEKKTCWNFEADFVANIHKIDGSENFKNLIGFGFKAGSGRVLISGLK
jgi:hypothetical protein